MFRCFVSSFKRNRYSLAFSSVYLIVEASKEKKNKTKTYLLQPILQRKKRPDSDAKLQLTQAPLLGHPHGHSAEATSEGIKGQT